MDPETLYQSLSSCLALGFRRAVRPRWAPDLSYGRHWGPPAPGTRSAAVAIVLYPDRDRWYLPLTLRPMFLADHAGQVSFPGGTAECRESACQCAMREFEEELGVTLEPEWYAGSLEPVYVFASGFWVTPCVVVSPANLTFYANPDEVAEVLEIEAHPLLDANRWQTHRLHRRGFSFDSPAYDHQGHIIWGATAVMLGQLAAVVQAQGFHRGALGSGDDGDRDSS